MSVARAIKQNEQEVFNKLIDILQEYNIESVAEIADVCPATIYFWLSGVTRLPRLFTITKVAQAVGYDVVLSLRTTSKKPRHLRIV